MNAANASGVGVAMQSCIGDIGRSNKVRYLRTSLAAFTKQPNADYIIGKRNRFHVPSAWRRGCLAHLAKQ
jgi:hypothetical protein